MTDQQIPIQLTTEETFLWDCARHWREPGRLADRDDLDWRRVFEIAQANWLQVLLHDVLAATGQLERLPSESRAALDEDLAKWRDLAATLGDSLQAYLRLAVERGIETAVMKGLSVSINVYGNPALRPGSDIDLLVRRADVAPSLALLEEMGLGQHWPNLLADAYYERHHLHQMRCTEDLKVWYEIHWALDHPYTRLTVDYEAVMDRTTPGELLGAPVRELSPPDLLLSLAVHLVKHAIYLPSTVARPDLARLVLADRMLLYFLDVAEVVKLHPAMDWQLAVDLARGWGAVDILGAVLRVCHDQLDAPVPAWVLDALPVEGAGGLTRRVLNRMADYEVVTYRGEQPSRFWEFMIVTNGAFILRPIRILDTAAYLLPGGGYLRRRYGSDSAATAARHLLRAVGEYARLGTDTVYYTWERYRRLKALGESASLFNRLPEDG